MSSLPPPVMIAFVAFGEMEMSRGLGSEGMTFLGLIFLALFIWSAVGSLFYRVAYSSFRERALQHFTMIQPRVTKKE